MEVETAYTKLGHFLITSNTKMKEGLSTQVKNFHLMQLLCLWQDYLEFRQYIKSKYIKFRIKVYIPYTPICYYYKFQYISRKDGGLSIKGHLDNAVLNLVEGKLENDHTLFTDRVRNGICIVNLHIIIIIIMLIKCHCNQTIFIYVFGGSLMQKLAHNTDLIALQGKCCWILNNTLAFKNVFHDFPYQ